MEFSFKKYIEFLERLKPNQNTKLICAQIRIGAHLLGYGNKIDVKFINEDKAIIFWKFIENLTKDIEREQKSYKIFISTDSKNVELEGVKYFGTDKTVINLGFNMHVDNNIYQNCSSMEKTLIDFHSFQVCDISVISQSQFGLFGIFYRGDPYSNSYILESKNIVKLSKKKSPSYL